MLVLICTLKVISIIAYCSYIKTILTSLNRFISCRDATVCMCQFMNIFPITKCSISYGSLQHISVGKQAMIIIHSICPISWILCSFCWIIIWKVRFLNKKKITIYNFIIKFSMGVGYKLWLIRLHYLFFILALLILLYLFLLYKYLFL